jgi:hypothetical protein
LNCNIEKSAAKEAYLPSLPTKPTPTLASSIMPTSFPPSPIARVLFFVYNPIFLVINAFCVGLHLQTQTLGVYIAIPKNYSSLFLSDNITSRLYPSIISKEPELLVSNSFNLYSASLPETKSLIRNIYYLLLLNPALTAIQVAVSTLSPVNIHILMPAPLSISIVSPTSSYNLSSTPVTPNSSISFSKSLIASATNYSLLFRLF